MAVYLVQHGKSLPKTEDPQKGLSEEGMDEVQRIAQVASQYQVHVDAILHSGKTRAAQTAQIMAKYLAPPNGVSAVDGIAPLDDAAAYAGRLNINSNLMIVGHLPFLERLISVLLMDNTEPPVFQMQNGGIVCLDRYRDTRQVAVKWALMPHIE